MQTWLLWVAQGFGLGRIPVAPGTFGSVAGLLWFLLLLRTGNLWLYLAGTCAGLLTAVYLCGLAERMLAERDPGSVVLDEIVAMPVCFLCFVLSAWLQTGKLPPYEWFTTAPTGYLTLVVFALFRLFDIGKPWPVRRSQELPSGWGVVADDVLAAMYVALLTLLAVA
jgi:phosphatidylglycerophosphatase A